jgi:hypothetical protein
MIYVTMQPQIGFGQRTTQATKNSLFQQMLYKPLVAFSLMHASVQILVSIVPHNLPQMKTLLFYGWSVFHLAWHSVM